MADFFTRLKELRKGRKLSMEQLAEEIGVAHVTISSWEAKKSQPCLDNILAVAKFFDVSVDYLVGNEEY